MSFFRSVSPTGAVRDFAQVWTGNRHRWATLAIALGATLGLMTIFIPKSELIPPAKPEVTYITTFAEGRTDAQILASNIENQKKQDELRALAAEQEEAKKELYRQIGQATFIDTDAMERDIARDKAADEAALKAKLAKDQAAREAAQSN